MRMATIEKLLGLGYDLDECYRTILTKPYAIRETLNEIAEWHHNELDYVDPGIALRLAQKYLDEVENTRVKLLADTIAGPQADQEQRSQAQDELTAAMRPAISRLVDEVAAHQDTKDALDFVRADIAGMPEIGFSWDYERDELVCEIIVKGKKAGTEYIKDILTARLMCAILMPPELRNELTTRLPIKNRIREA